VQTAVTWCATTFVDPIVSYYTNTPKAAVDAVVTQAI
jgi:hypothetical protein